MGSDPLFGDMVNTVIRIVLFLMGALSISASTFAQVDLAGSWQALLHEEWQARFPGPDPVDFLGLPLNDEGRARALSYSSTAISLPERQCLYYAPHYVLLGPMDLSMWADTDLNTGAVVAWNIGAASDRAIITIWMDGRPEPAEYAVHPIGGFATGVWEGRTLTAKVTHFKESYLRRNGAPVSDLATLTMHISRHGDVLTIVGLVDDPVYLSEPYIVSRSWRLQSAVIVPRVSIPCAPVSELPGDEASAVPSYFPGKNPFVEDLTKLYHIPVEATLGGAQTMYPEFRNKLRDQYVRPARCTQYCCGGFGRPPPQGLSCIMEKSTK